MLLSKYLELDDKLDSLGVFDCLLDEDSPFFINVILLKETSVPEFSDSYVKILELFRKVLKLLKFSNSAEDKCFKTAYRLFNFKEMNEINLGFAKSNGAAWGSVLRRIVLQSAKAIVDAGTQDPEMFLLLELFESNIGPDRISDMISTIIREDIIGYTRNINSQLGINEENYPNIPFEDGFIINPYRNRKVYYLPKSILNKIPVAKEWSNIDNVIDENKIIRAQINEAIAEEWYKLSCEEKKREIKRSIMLNPTACSKAINEFKKTDVEAIRVSDDYRYGSKELFEKRLFPVTDFSASNKELNSLSASFEVLNLFKDWVEHNKGWQAVTEFPSVNREKLVQRLIHLSAKSFIEKNGLDISFEPNAGPGPCDIKVSRGDDKTVIEVKLSSNPKYIQGYDTQIGEYAKAEKAQNQIYVYVDVGHPIKLKRIVDMHETRIKSNIPHPELFVIDSTKKDSASNLLYN